MRDPCLPLLSILLASHGCDRGGHGQHELLQHTKADSQSAVPWGSPAFWRGQSAKHQGTAIGLQDVLSLTPSSRSWHAKALLKIVEHNGDGALLGAAPSAPPRLLAVMTLQTLNGI